VAPLLCALAILPFITTSVHSQPWLWALPFLFTFVGGVFADLFETRQRKYFLGLSGALLLVQISLCLYNIQQMTQK
jgi:hypothetical protein